jgi:hypothetical protein
MTPTAQATARRAARKTVQQTVQHVRRRRTERGMAVFLVVLMLTLVTAIGIFSMHSASLVNRATGFHRQNVQATAIAELGARGAATWLGSNKDEIRRAMENPKLPKRDPNCAPKLLSTNLEASCWLILDDSLESQFAATAPPFSDGLDGLLSPPTDTTTELRADFGMEVTGTYQANAAAAPGSPIGSLVEVTVTTRARVFPIDSSITSSCGAASRGAVSQQRVRSHLLVQLP